MRDPIYAFERSIALLEGTANVEGASSWLRSERAWVRDIPLARRAYFAGELLETWAAAQGIPLTFQDSGPVAALEVQGRRVEAYYAPYTEPLYVYQTTKAHPEAHAVFLVGLAPHSEYVWWCAPRHLQPGWMLLNPSDSVGELQGGANLEDAATFLRHLAQAPRGPDAVELLPNQVPAEG